MAVKILRRDCNGKPGGQVAETAISSIAYLPSWFQ